MQSGFGKLTWITNCICILHKFMLYAISWEWSKEHLVLQWKKEHLMSSHDQCHKCALISDPERVQNRKCCLYIIFVLTFLVLNCSTIINDLTVWIADFHCNHQTVFQPKTCPSSSSTSYNNIGIASFTIQKPVKTESAKAGDLARTDENKSPGAEKVENKLAAAPLSRWGRVKSKETIGSETSSLS